MMDKLACLVGVGSLCLEREKENDDEEVSGKRDWEMDNWVK